MKPIGTAIGPRAAGRRGGGLSGPADPGTAVSAADAGATTGPELDDGEELLLVLRGIGAVMFLTDTRMIVARDGFERRPKTGIQSFRFETLGLIRLELGTSPSGRIAVRTAEGHEVASMFFDARSVDRARELIDRARPLIARTRRRGLGARGSGERSVRPGRGPTGTGSGLRD